MTSATPTTGAAGAATAAGARRPAGLVDRIAALPVAALVAALVIAAFGVRALGLHTAFELWVDEMLYAELGASVARGELPNLPDGPFFLHPPGFFLVEAAAIRVLGITGGSMDLVHQLRWVGAAAGALTVGLVFLVVRRAVGGPAANGTVAALLAGVLAVFEPFVLRNNSRVFLETAGVLAALVGLALVVDHLARPDRAAGARGTARLVLAGLALGYGVLTKDVIAVCAVVPVVLALLWRRTLTRREATILIGTAVLPYAVYLSVLVLLGRIGDWFTAKSEGALRMLGFIQATGFNAPDSPSLVGRLVAQVGFFGTSYVLLLVCPLVGVVAALGARPERRFVGLVAVATGLFGVYSAAFGTFEENYGYPVAIAAILAAPVAVVELRERRPRLRRATTAVCLVFVLCATALGLRTELTRDDGFRQVRSWVAANLPADARVGVTNSTGELAFADDPRFAVRASLPELAGADASYVLTQSLPTSLGYGFARPELLPWLAANATPVIAVPGPTNGVTTLWYVDPAVREAGAAARVAFPANEPEK